MPIPWFCGICGKTAFNRFEMCIHLKEEYGMDFIEDHTAKNTSNANSSSDNDSLFDDPLSWIDDCYVAEKSE